MHEVATFKAAVAPEPPPAGLPASWVATATYPNLCCHRSGHQATGTAAPAASRFHQRTSWARQGSHKRLARPLQRLEVFTRARCEHGSTLGLHLRCDRPEGVCILSVCVCKHVTSVLLSLALLVQVRLASKKRIAGPAEAMSRCKKPKLTLGTTSARFNMELVTSKRQGMQSALPRLVRQG